MGKLLASVMCVCVGGYCVGQLLASARPQHAVWRGQDVWNRERRICRLTGLLHRGQDCLYQALADYDCRNYLIVIKTGTNFS